MTTGATYSATTGGVSSGGGSGDNPMDDVQVYEKTEFEDPAIPDDDPNGLTTTINVEEEGNLSGLTLDLEIEHTYKGDLVIQLEKDGTTVTVYDGADVDRGWEDNVNITGKEIDGFGGLDVKGAWNLKIVDTMRRDTGSIQSWSIKPRLE